MYGSSVNMHSTSLDNLLGKWHLLPPDLNTTTKELIWTVITSVVITSISYNKNQPK